MGSGKTYWGKIWADKLHYEFLDLDDQIELESGMKITDIFDQYGEEKFRELEKGQLRKFGTGERKMISCGGGAPCFHGNMDWMLQNGIVIYLKASPNYIYGRISGEIEKRPLLKKQTTTQLPEYITRKLEEREPEYNRAHYIFDVDNLDEDSIQLAIKGIDHSADPLNNSKNKR